MLIAVRVVVITTLVLAALIIQYTVRELLPINYLYTIAPKDGLSIGMIANAFPAPEIVRRDSSVISAVRSSHSISS